MIRESMNDCYDIAAIILAGGLGTRLHSVVADRPKVIAPVNGRPFISYLLDQLADAGFRDVTICTGYKAEMIEEALGNRYKELNLRYSRELEPLGTGGALRHALPIIKETTVMVMNGDSYIDVSLQDYMKWYFSNRIEASILLAKVADASRYGRIRVGMKNRVISIEEKKENAGAGYVNAGIYILKKHMIEHTIPVRKFSLEREFFPALISSGLCAYSCENDLLDIGTPESYARAATFLPI